MVNSGIISGRLSKCADRLETLINERANCFLLPADRGIQLRFLDGTNLTHEIIRQDLSKFLFGLRGQSEDWSTGRFQGQTVRKEQLISGFTPLLRDWDLLLNAWMIYSIRGDGMSLLRNLYSDVLAISLDSLDASFPS
jgi:hypothetical protein